jgi:hypothetical protein
MDAVEKRKISSPPPSPGNRTSIPRSSSPEDGHNTKWAIKQSSFIDPVCSVYRLFAFSRQFLHLNSLPKQAPWRWVGGGTSTRDPWSWSPIWRTSRKVRIALSERASWWTARACANWSQEYNKACVTQFWHSRLRPCDVGHREPGFVCLRVPSSPSDHVAQSRVEVFNLFCSRTPRYNFSSTLYPQSCWCIIQVIHSL